MFSFKFNKKSVREVILFGGLGLIIIVAALAMVPSQAYANPSLGEQIPTDVPPQPPQPPGNNINADQKCKMLVYPRSITLGEPFEVCWIGSKFSDVKLGPNGSLSPLEADPYTKQLDDGKGLFCHSYLVPSFSNTDLDPGTYDFRCTGPGGTILATTVKVVDSE